MLTETTPFAWLEFDTPARQNESTLVESPAQASIPELSQVEGSPTFKVSAKQLYTELNRANVSMKSKRTAQQYLQDQLSLTIDLDSDLPADINAIAEWIDSNNDAVGREYRRYLEARRQGAPRRYFTTKSHALNFLQSVAPTKLVDGSWLYGFVNQWDDARFAALTRIYLEELGDGQSGKNHVVLYKKLLDDNGCDNWQALGDDYFTQGAIQLALGHNVEEFLPETIGFNLGYEQLPLHLLITAYELNELDIGPYYFTLHVTVDNASTGHARKSLQGLMDSAPVLADRQAFYARVLAGYKLNQLGLSTNDIIEGFDNQSELLAMLSTKSVYGQSMHSDYCRIAGRTVNDWLSDPALIPQFVDSLVDHGWIVRHQDPALSRFWKLIDSDNAEMFGVFNSYEKQLIWDWIAGDALTKGARAAGMAEFPARQPSYRMNQRKAALKEQDGLYQPQRSAAIRTNDDHYHAFDPDILRLEQQVANMHSKQEIMQLLGKLMSPAMHHTPVGLLATRLYKSMLEGYGQVSSQSLHTTMMADVF